MAISLHRGRRTTLAKVDAFADGVAVKTVGRETFRLCRQLVDGQRTHSPCLLLLSERCPHISISACIYLGYKRMRIGSDGYCSRRVGTASSLAARLYDRCG